MRSDFYGLPWAAQQAIRKGERDASAARRRAYSIVELRAKVDELEKEIERLRALTKATDTESGR